MMNKEIRKKLKERGKKETQRFLNSTKGYLVKQLLARKTEFWQLGLDKIHSCKITYTTLMDVNKDKLINKSHWMDKYMVLQICSVMYQAKVIVYVFDPVYEIVKSTIVHDGRQGEFVFKQKKGLRNIKDKQDTLALLYDGYHFHYVELIT